MRKFPLLFLFVMSIAGIAIILLINFCNVFVGEFWGDFLPLANTFASIFLGAGLGSIIYSNLNSRTKRFLYLLFILSTITVYSSNYYINYHLWQFKYAKKKHTSVIAANIIIENYLLKSTGYKGFIGYLKHNIAKDPDSEIDFGEPESILWLFQYISSLFKIHIAGLIEMIFWYIFSWIWIYLGINMGRPRKNVNVPIEELKRPE